MTSGIAYTAEETEVYKRQIVETLAESVHGTFSGACHKHGVSKTVGYEWRQADEEFDRAVQQARHIARQGGLDMAEGKLIQAVGNGELTAIIFYLKTQGKERGYVERQETDLGVRPGLTDDDKDIIARGFALLKGE